MNTWKKRLIRTPILGGIALFLFRSWLCGRYILGVCRAAIVWLFTSRETTNFTYALEEKNVGYLASFIASVTRCDSDEILGYISELQNDTELRNHIRRRTAASDLAKIADTQIEFGKRLGWYAFARATKPRIIVETGIDKGLGAVVLTAALRRNAAEGSPGKYFGTDINPEAGYLFTDEYAELGEILYGDSIESLVSFPYPIDLFINDSDHSADYEAREYEAIAEKLAPGAIVLGDNSHVTRALLDFSRHMRRQFLFFRESPKDHWYPGGGIGVSFEA
jgi:predicted O-methyltransferase YrrM